MKVKGFGHLHVHTEFSTLDGMAKIKELISRVKELGQEFTPPVNRAAVNKWETNRVENIKRSYIQKMSELFGVSPCELMRFDDRFDSAKAAEETKAIELVQKHFGKDAVHVLQMFMEVNQTGQQKVLEDLSDMTELSKYTEKRETALKNA